MTPTDWIQIGSLLVAALAILGNILIMRNQKSTTLWDTRFEAYKSLEVDSEFDSYLSIHNISEEKLQYYGITKEELRAYLRFMYSLWVSLFNTKMYRKIQKKQYYEQKIHYIRSKGFVHSDKCMSGRLIRSEKFIRCWDLLKYFWDTDSTSATIPYIEATIRHSQKRPDFFMDSRH